MVILAGEIRLMNVMLQFPPRELFICFRNTRASEFGI